MYGPLTDDTNQLQQPQSSRKSRKLSRYMMNPGHLPSLPDLSRHKQLSPLVPPQMTSHQLSLPVAPQMTSHQLSPLVTPQMTFHQLSPSVTPQMASSPTQHPPYLINGLCLKTPSEFSTPSIPGIPGILPLLVNDHLMLQPFHPPQSLPTPPQ